MISSKVKVKYKLERSILSCIQEQLELTIDFDFYRANVEATGFSVTRCEHDINFLA